MDVSMVKYYAGGFIPGVGVRIVKLLLTAGADVQQQEDVSGRRKPEF
jgi:hypothetical protein